jgi:hypothetical protein
MRAGTDPLLFTVQVSPVVEETNDAAESVACEALKSTIGVAPPMVE